MSLLDDVMIAAPCNLAWEEMPGDDRVRHCTGCSKNVYNISAMSKSEAERFLEQNGTTECMRLYRRADGTIITDNCPVGLRKLRDRARNVFHFASALISNLIAVTCAFAHEEAPRSSSQQGEEIPVITKPWPNGKTTGKSLPYPGFYNGYSTMRPNVPAQRKGTTFIGSECSTQDEGDSLPSSQTVPRMLLGKPARPAASSSSVGIPASAQENSNTAGSGADVTSPANNNRNVGHSPSPAADTTAHTLYVNAQAEEFRGNYILALPLYYDATRAAKANTNSDPNFVRILEQSVVRVRSRIQNPIAPASDALPSSGTVSGEQ